MTFLDYITKDAPAACEVHPSFGEVARLIFNSEKDGGNPAFAPEAFGHTRARAALAVPYQVDDVVMREHVIDVVELAICNHRQAKHGKDHADRITLLEARPMNAEEREMATRDWWNE